jgi:hypothetical protein
MSLGGCRQLRQPAVGEVAVHKHPISQVAVWVVRRWHGLLGSRTHPRGGCRARTLRLGAPAHRGHGGAHSAKSIYSSGPHNRGPGRGVSGRRPSAGSDRPDDGPYAPAAVCTCTQGHYQSGPTSRGERSSPERRRDASTEWFDWFMPFHAHTLPHSVGGPPTSLPAWPCVRTAERHRQTHDCMYRGDGCGTVSPLGVTPGRLRDVSGGIRI